jgi:hypothetical protein
MRTVSPAWPYALAYSHPLVTRIDSWYGGSLVLADVPLTAGTITFDDTGTLKRALRIAVPRQTYQHGRLDPGGDPYGPLAAYGQRLHVRTGIGHADGTSELLDWGWYLITGWSLSEDDTLTVDAADLARLIQGRGFTAPAGPGFGASFYSAFSSALDGILPLAPLPDGLEDGPVSPTMVWDRDRLAAINNICEAWPARWFVDDTGTIQLAPPYPDVPSDAPADVTLIDGNAGTVVHRARAAQRGAIFNTVVVTGRAGAGATPHAVASITDPASPIHPDGPYGAETRYLSSDLVTDQAQAELAAAALLAQSSTVGRTEIVTCIPDASVQLGDIRRVITADADPLTGRVTAGQLPLTAGQGDPMTLVISNAPRGTITGRNL